VDGESADPKTTGAQAGRLECERHPQCAAELLLNPRLSARRLHVLKDAHAGAQTQKKKRREPDQNRFESSVHGALAITDLPAKKARIVADGNSPQAGNGSRRRAGLVQIGAHFASTARRRFH